MSCRSSLECPFRVTQATVATTCQLLSIASVFISSSPVGPLLEGHFHRSEPCRTCSQLGLGPCRGLEVTAYTCGCPLTSASEQLGGRAETSGCGSSCAVAPLGAGPRRTRIRAATRAGAVGRRMFTAAEVGAANRRAVGRGAPGRGAPEELQVRSGGRSRGPDEAGGRAAAAALGPACGGRGAVRPLRPFSLPPSSPYLPYRWARAPGPSPGGASSSPRLPVLFRCSLAPTPA